METRLSTRVGADFAWNLRRSVDGVAKQMTNARRQRKLEDFRRDSPQAPPDAGTRSSTTVGAIVILLLYQGYTLSIVGHRVAVDSEELRAR